MTKLKSTSVFIHKKIIGLDDAVDHRNLEGDLIITGNVILIFFPFFLKMTQLLKY